MNLFAGLSDYVDDIPEIILSQDSEVTLNYTQTTFLVLTTKQESNESTEEFLNIDVIFLPSVPLEPAP